jgi:hypothetical protein
LNLCDFFVPFFSVGLFGEQQAYQFWSSSLFSFLSLLLLLSHIQSFPSAPCFQTLSIHSQSPLIRTVTFLETVVREASRYFP